MAGRPIPFESIKVTELDKQRVVGARGGAARVGLEWPDVKPPFAYTAVLPGADGRLWVQRYAPAADTRTPYDIIDRSGAVVARAYVPNAGRVVGFGARSIYVVRRDADDLQYLQRFPL